MTENLTAVTLSIAVLLLILAMLIGIYKEADNETKAIQAGLQQCFVPDRAGYMHKLWQKECNNGKNGAQSNNP